jgi:hypothetical protein
MRRRIACGNGAGSDYRVRNIRAEMNVDAKQTVKLRIASTHASPLLLMRRTISTGSRLRGAIELVATTVHPATGYPLRPWLRAVH